MNKKRLKYSLILSLLATVLVNLPGTGSGARDIPSALGSYLSYLQDNIVSILLFSIILTPLF